MIRKRSSSNILPSKLGELELIALETLWEHGQLDAKTLLQRLPLYRRCALSTMQSTLERLYRKTLVTRDKQGHAYQYAASISRPELLSRFMGDVIHLLHDGRMETILSSFVSVAAELDEHSLDQLEALVRARKKSRQERQEKELK